MTLPTDIPLIILPDRLAISRLAADAEYPEWARSGDLLALVRTRDELSIVCAERFVPPDVRSERGWRVIQVQGQLDFNLIGILAAISNVLAQSGVPIFAVSTFDTDYILVKDGMLDRATAALSSAGYLVLNNVRISA